MGGPRGERWETGSRLYGPHQSRFARYLERRERERPDPVARELRRRLLVGLRGRVLEVGCGDGRSFEHYPTSVTQLVAVEPDPTARAVAAERARATAVPIDVVNGTAEALPAEDGSFDAVVSMGVLCTVSDPAATLAEVRRVLDPTGELRFWEHSARASCRCACSNGHWTCSSGRARWLAAVRRATPRRRSPHPGSSSSPSIAASTHHRR